MSPDQIPPMQEAVGIGVIIGFSVFYIAAYIFFAICLAKIAVRLGRPFGKSLVLMLIPIVNIFYLLGLGGKPWWWFILLLIPLVNIIFAILLWISICEKLGKPNWWGVLMIIPIVNMILIIILAFGKGEASPAAA